MNSLFRGSLSCGSPCGPDGRSSPRVVSHLPAPDPQRVSIPGPGKIFCCSFLDFGIPNHLVEISNTPPNKAWAQSFSDIYPHYVAPQVESETKELSAPQGHRQVFPSSTVSVTVLWESQFHAGVRVLVPTPHPQLPSALNHHFGFAAPPHFWRLQLPLRVYYG